MKQSVLQKIGKFIQRTTLKQCENLTVDLLAEKTQVSETEIQSILDFLETENVVVKKYIFHCKKCGEMNTFTADMITGDDTCQICEGSIDVNSYISGAEIRYVLDKNNFMELLDEEGIVIPKRISIKKPVAKTIPFEIVKISEKIEEAQESNSMEKGKNAQLFISHATKDVPYIKVFVKFLEDLGLDENNMFCSSIDGYGIHWGDNIYDYLEGRFNNQDDDLIVLFMLSDNYYDSPACLNEMGAAWVLKKTYKSILLPGFEFKDIQGAVDPRKIAIKLDDQNLRIKLNDVKKQFTEIFGLKDISDTKWDRIREELITSINDIKSGNV